MNYKVLVQRPVWESSMITVEARDEVSAADAAVEKAMMDGDLKWTTDDMIYTESDYIVCHVEEVRNPQ